MAKFNLLVKKINSHCHFHSGSHIYAILIIALCFCKVLYCTLGYKSVVE